MTRRELDFAMRAVLVQLSVCSHVPAAGWGPTGRSRSSDDLPGGAKPPGDLGQLVYARRYGPPFHEPTPEFPGCATDAQRERLLHATQRDLAHIRGLLPRDRPAGESTAQRNARIVKEGQGFTVREVAIRFRCGERDVRKARTALGRDPDGGHPVPTADKSAVARELRATGASTREIAKVLAVHQTQVMRWLRQRSRPLGV